MTYYRIHDTGRCRPEDLLLSENQVSRVWQGVMYRQCPDCGGSGVEDLGWCEADQRVLTCRCERCRGDGQEQMDRQDGVSVCRTIGQLEAYLADRSPSRANTVLVELEGDECDDQDLDAEHGALLVRPTRIISVRSINELDVEWSD